MTETSTAYVHRIHHFLQSPAGGATALLLASLAGFALANSAWCGGYEALITTPMRLSILGSHTPDTLEAWVSDGLMTLFFLLIILEIKKEMVSGHLSSMRQIALPLIGALGGMAVPALTYFLVTYKHAEAVHGWAIPVATDAAFTLPVIMALGTRVSAGARAWLMALAIFDDVLGIVVIALFYGSALYWPALAGVLCVTVGMIAANRLGCRSLWVYSAGCLLLWGMLLSSGLHPTLAGVITGLCLPAQPPATDTEQMTPLEKVSSALTPFVTWLVLPLFGFMNVGVSLAGMHMDALLAPVPLGIMLGLIIGKPVGVFGATILSFQLRIAPVPAATSIKMLFGLSLLCGIGFTISLFIAGLAFKDADTIVSAKLGIFAGSVVAALAGWSWLRCLPVEQPSQCSANLATMSSK
ncbi:Na(+)/H(+) antiporter NhaA [Acetobacter pasteurianus]|uniref:Na(+)/H(+) antiporter NhaA n=3 Tax=Acetobacter pasteurianus TaxID=438 RepID=C7JHK6_ACEP3|nr:Na+/H+ antiporter NhaA [Acetobacter pasteurianus]BAU38374.1 Na+/H+ antiporter NhaA [Acetobacter pasteurianus NBRC 101655]ASC07042.1 Na(+)/H(+) antiporter NhaA [Acetobacter pasteurianus subsp. pasteurianus]BAH99460.1 Na+/H+ Antiporter NhaA [Acetobacter pasteurianus IFO 3283-01]BAI02513.1 Na+/H+ Antiporter NhaA [Acetobacter pasteurianus IFO 3283-03]BAI05559.1 Na+/H+ Antiporter NhaA [Acetobacter pasteurianus IFO 3283-07]